MTFIHKQSEMKNSCARGNIARSSRTVKRGYGKNNDYCIDSVDFDCNANRVIAVKKNKKNAFKCTSPCVWLASHHSPFKISELTQYLFMRSWKLILTVLERTSTVIIISTRDVVTKIFPLHQFIGVPKPSVIYSDVTVPRCFYNGGERKFNVLPLLNNVLITTILLFWTKNSKMYLRSRKKIIITCGNTSRINKEIFSSICCVRGGLSCNKTANGVKFL